MLRCAALLRRIPSAMLAAAVCACATPAFALDPHLAPSQYVRNHWGRAEGIPDTSVFAITQTQDGYLWLGTEMGLVRFDGVRFTLYSPRTTPALEAEVIRSLLEARDGALWIGARNGLFRYAHGEFQRLGPESAEASIISDVFQDREGRVWVSSEGDLGYFEGSDYHAFLVPGGAHLEGVSRVRQASDGTLWFSGSDRIFRWRDNHLETIRLEDVSQTVADGARGRVWAFPADHMRLVAGEGVEPTDQKLIAARMAISSLEDRDGTLWIGTISGLVRCREGALSLVDLDPQRPSSVALLYEDREGRLWIGTMGDGVWCLQNPRVLTFAKPEGLEVGSVSTVLQARDGAFWIGTTTQGLVRWEGPGSRAECAAVGLPRLDISALLEDSQGTLWAGTPGGLVQSKGKDAFDPVSLPCSGVPGVYSLAELPDGTVLAGTSAGVLALRGGRWSLIDPPQGYGFPLAIEPDGSSGAWFGTLGRGLLHWDGRSVTSFGRSKGFTSADVSALFVDREKRLWIGTTDGGMVVWNGISFRALTSAEGLPEGPIYRILEAEECLWLSGKLGITRLRESDLEEWLAGREPAVKPAFFGATEGMRNPECNGGYQPAGCKDRDGALWFPTMDGLVRADPKALSFRPQPPRVLLEEVLVEGEPAKRVGGDLRLPPGQMRIEVHYTAPFFPPPRGLRFDCRLEGFDRDWVSAGDRRAAYYTNLPAGTYRFRVRAREGEGPWAECADTLAIVQAPHFWQTWPFLLGCAGGLALLLYGFYRLRLRTMRRRFEAVLEERGRISREIHDSLTQSFAGIVLNLEAADRGWESGGSASRERVAKAKAVAREGLVEARRFIRGLRPLLLETEDLAPALERAVREAAANGAAEVSFHFIGKRRRYSPELEDHLLRITQEAVGNASRYAEASHIRVALTATRSEITWTVKDDGKGFDPQSVVPREEGGYGLRGIRERVASMKGTCKIESEKGKGTRIEIKVPVR